MNNWYIKIKKISQRQKDPVKDPPYVNIGHSDNEGDYLWYIDDKWHFIDKLAQMGITHREWLSVAVPNWDNCVISSGRYDALKNICSMVMYQNVIYKSFGISDFSSYYETIKKKIANKLYQKYNCQDVIYYN